MWKFIICEGSFSRFNADINSLHLIRNLLYTAVLLYNYTNFFTSWISWRGCLLIPHPPPFPLPNCLSEWVMNFQFWGEVKNCYPSLFLSALGIFKKPIQYISVISDIFSAPSCTSLHVPLSVPLSGGMGFVSSPSSSSSDSGASPDTDTAFTGVCSVAGTLPP